MSLFKYLILLVCVLGMSAGQILFKIASKNFPQSLNLRSLLDFSTNKYLLLALFIYGAATILWIYALKLMPLSVAYPFMALAFVIVPALSFYLLNEPMSGKLLIGTSIIIVGLFIAVK